MRSTLLVLSLLLALPGCRSSDSRNVAEEAEVTPAGPGVRALLDGLKDGDTLGDLHVDRVLVVWEGMLRIDTSDEAGHRQRLVVTLLGEGPLPPTTSKKYAVFFGSPAPDAGGPPDKERVAKAVEALAARLRKSEDSVAMPAGMTTYGSVRTTL